MLKKRKMRIVVATILFIFVVILYFNLIGVLFPGLIPKDRYKYESVEIPEVSELQEVKIAFFGDQGVSEDSKEVLNMIKEENVDLIMLLGDFDYEDNPKKFKEMYESVYRDDYPLLSVIGNHDILKWSEYKDWMSKINIDNLNCNGDYGVASVCNFGPVSFVISAIGTLPGEHTEFLEDVLPRVDNSWKICVWHKNHNGYQAGGKKTEVDLDTYQLCADNDAIIITGHEHSYSRTHGMSDIRNFVVGDNDSPYDMFENSLVVVSGLGGKSVRDTHDDLKDIWGSIYSNDQGAVAGSLICTFRKQDADCEFINTDREVIDEFKMVK